MLIFSPHEMKYIRHLPRKSKLSFYFILNGNTESQPYFSLGRFSFDLTFAVCLLGITLGANLENGLESYFNEWNARNQHSKKVY